MCERVELRGDPRRRRQGCEKGGALTICMCICAALCCPIFKIEHLHYFLTIWVRSERQTRGSQLSQTHRNQTWLYSHNVCASLSTTRNNHHQHHPTVCTQTFISGPFSSKSVTTIPDVLFPEKLHIPSAVFRAPRCVENTEPSWLISPNQADPECVMDRRCANQVFVLMVDRYNMDSQTCWCAGRMMDGNLQQTTKKKKKTDERFSC